KYSSTNSGAITDSTKVYDPVFGDFTILIALVMRFEPVCNDATDFFAMTYIYFIYLCTVTLFRIALNFLISNLSGVFFLFLVVMYRDVPGSPDSLCSVHSKITWILFPFLSIVYDFYLFWNTYLINHFAFSLFSVAFRPFFFI